MERRKFLLASGIASLAAPAMAQPGLPEIRWRMASSYPKTLATIYGSGAMFAQRVSDLTGGRFKISVHAAGEIVPPLQVLDAVRDASVECGHTASYFYIGKDPAFAFGTAMPFGLNTRGQNAWFTLGGGQELLDEFYAGYGLKQLPLGSTGAQMAGWFRKEVKAVADLKGLKFRVGGLAGTVLQKVGVVPQQLAAGDLYPALEKGTIDAAEFVGPYDDEKLGLHKVARYYYYPGWWEGAGTISLFINSKAWAALPKEYQIALSVAATEAHHWSTAKYDAENPQAMIRLVGAGAQPRPFPRDVMDACYKASQEVYAEMVEKSPAFKKIFEQWSRFRGNQILWNRFCELPFDSYMGGTLKSKSLTPS